MRIEYCPKCGASDPGTDIDGDPSCEECDWFYGTKEYQRIGTHPREFDRYCEECVTVYPTSEAAEQHLCTVTGLLEEYGESWPLEAIREELMGFHGDSRAERKIRNGIKEQEIAFTVDFERIVLWPEDGAPALCGEIVRLLREWERTEEELMRVSDLETDLGCSTDMERTCLRNCVRTLDRSGVLLWDRRGLLLQ